MSEHIKDFFHKKNGDNIMVLSEASSGTLFYGEREVHINIRDSYEPIVKFDHVLAELFGPLITQKHHRSQNIFTATARTMNLSQAILYCLNEYYPASCPNKYGFYHTFQEKFQK